jgi:LPXTG-site transpeptidase (sortase) family protein
MFKFVNSQVFRNFGTFFGIAMFTICFFFGIPFGSTREIVLENPIENEKEYIIEIPAISLKENLCNVDRDICLEKGIWLKSFNLKKGNFLLTGHSFFIYPLKAGVLYSLEEVTLGDYIYLYFNGRTYIYEITNISIHDRYDLEIEDFKDGVETLKIYTCYPAWSNLKRLVVEARRVSY